MRSYVMLMMPMILVAACGGNTLDDADRTEAAVTSSAACLETVPEQPACTDLRTCGSATLALHDGVYRATVPFRVQDGDELLEITNVTTGSKLDKTSANVPDIIDSFADARTYAPGRDVVLVDARGAGTGLVVRPGPNRLVYRTRQRGTNAETSEDEVILDARFVCAPKMVKVVSMCFSGASLGPSTRVEGNKDLMALCEKLPNLIRGKDGAYFTWRQTEGSAMKALIEAVDTNHDGKVTHADEPFDLNIVGYSWGAFNARDFIKAIAHESRIEDKSVARFVAIDPFILKVFKAKGIRIPDTVRNFYEFRHTIAPSSECTKGSAFGPYLGQKPICGRSTTCTDYDYSLSSADVHYGSFLSGSEIDHCNVVSVAERAVIALVKGEPTEGLPPTRPVEGDE